MLAAGVASLAGLIELVPLGAVYLAVDDLVAGTGTQDGL